MKKCYSILTLAVAAMAAFSCAKELEVNVESEKAFEPKVISAFTDADVTPDTKTSLDGVSILWATTDNIKGIDGSNAVHTSTATAVSEGNKKATFTFSTVSVEDDLLFLAYPAEKVSNIDGNYVYATLPTTQAATAGSFANKANLAIAEGLDANPSFKNVGGLLSFTINNDDITSVTLSANEDLTGDAKISVAGATFAQPTITAGKKFVTVSGTIVNGSTYYAVVYPGTYTGLKIEVRNSAGQVATYSNPNSLTVARNGNLHIATLTIPAGKWVTPTKGDSYSWTFASGDLGSSDTPATSVTKGSPSLTWNAAWSFTGSNYIGSLNATNGLQIGSGGNPCESLVLSTSGYTGYIERVRINFTQAGSGAAAVAVSVKDVTFKNGENTSASASDNTPTNYDFTNPTLIKGDVEITFTNGAAKAFYIKSIEINPDLRTSQTLSFPQAAYSAEITDGTFASPTLSGAHTSVTYTSNNTDVATVNASTGVVTLVATGNARITATAEADEDYKEGSAYYDLTVTNGPSSIATVLAAANDASVYTSGVVAQVNAKGFIITDGTDNLQVYQNATPTAVEGQFVKVSGTRSTYNNVPQISSPVITYGATGQSITRTDKTTITSSNCTGNTSSTYVQLAGNLSLASSNYYISISGTDAVNGRIYQPVTTKSYGGTTIPDMVGGAVNVTGYVAGNSASLLYIAPVDIKFVKYAVPESAGYADNSSISFAVSANCDWTAAIGTDANSIIKSVTYNATSVTVTFNANAGDAKSAQVVITPAVVSGVQPINVTVNQVANGASSIPADETFTFSTMGYSNGGNVSSVSGTNVNISFKSGAKYYTTGSGVRIYSGGNFVVTASGDHKIKQIVCTYSGDGYAPNSSSSENNYATYSTTGSTASGSLTYGASSTWTCATDDPASSVTIQRKTASDHWRLQEVIVKFAQ